jgi:hypothetical protein
MMKKLVAETARICANCSASEKDANGFCHCRRYGLRVARKGICETIDVRGLEELKSLKS